MGTAGILGSAGVFRSARIRGFLGTARILRRTRIGFDITGILGRTRIGFFGRTGVALGKRHLGRNDERSRQSQSSNKR